MKVVVLIYLKTLADTRSTLEASDTCSRVSVKRTVTMYHPGEFPTTEMLAVELITSNGTRIAPVLIQALDTILVLR